MILLKSFAILVLICQSMEAAKILGVFTMASYSHFMLGNRLMRELALKGHEVTYISPYKDKNPVRNYRDVTITGLNEEVEEKKKERDWFAQPLIPIPQFVRSIFVSNMLLEVTDASLRNENVQKLLNSNETFDLIIIEQFMNDALRGFQHKYKAPCIIFSCVGASRFVNHIVANPAPTSYISDMFMAFEDKHMTFWMRLQNTLFSAYSDMLLFLYAYPKQNEMLHKYFPDAPDIFDLVYETPLILLNSHISTNRPAPMAPNMIDIGGFHVFPPKKLPDNLQKYMDESKHGVILFSMGSNLKSKDMPPEKREAILKAFGKLKLDVLWKWEDDDLPGKPDNVKLEKWLPQQDIMPHPKLKLFLTHGGLLSTTEAIYHGVPIVGLPMFGDQQINMGLAAQNGYGISLNFQELNEELLSNAINEVLTNPIYVKNVKKRQKLMHDRPMAPIDTAVWWVEYVLRNPESDFYRSPAVDMKWYQLMLLDVLLFIFVATAVLVGLIFYAVKNLCCNRNKGKNQKDLVKKKN